MGTFSIATFNGPSCNFFVLKAMAAQDDSLEGDAGQPDLEAAIDAKLSSQNLEDFDRVLELCKTAIKKGLPKDSKQFAEDLYTGTLVDRAGMVVEAIFDPPSPNEQWPRMRKDALRDLDEAISRDPKLGEAHLMIAKLERLPGGDLQRAKKAVDSALELVANDNLQMAQAHVLRGDLEEDRESRQSDYDKAVELAPRDKDIRRSRGLFHLLGDEFEKAIADLGVAIEEDPKDAGLHEALGMAQLMLEKLDDAEKSFDRAVELEPDSSGPRLQRARVLALRGESPKALADLEKAIQLEPNDAIPLVLRARIHQQAGDTDSAKQDLEQVLEKFPDHPAALELRGLIAADANDYASAIRDFQKLAAQNLDDPLLAGQLGMLYLAAKQPREAIRRFSRAIELDDAQFASRRGRSDALISIGNHEEALVDLEKALQLKPLDSGVLNNLYWLLSTSPDDALRDGKRAIELATKACEQTEWKEAHIISTLAAGYAETGDFEEAKKYSAKAVEASDVKSEVQKQLQNELTNYEAGKPWREKQEMAESEDSESATMPSDTKKSKPQPKPSSPDPDRKVRRPFDD